MAMLRNSITNKNRLVLTRESKRKLDLILQWWSYLKDMGNRYRKDGIWWWRCTLVRIRNIHFIYIESSTYNSVITLFEMFHLIGNWMVIENALYLIGYDLMFGIWARKKLSQLSLEGILLECLQYMRESIF